MKALTRLKLLTRLKSLLKTFNCLTSSGSIWIFFFYTLGEYVYEIMILYNTFLH